jgi:hypothetical protein
MRRKFSGYIFMLLLLFSAGAAFSGAEEIAIHQQFDNLLQAHVADGMVDYQGFKKDEKILDQYLDTLNKTDPEMLPEDQKLAFYINAYNAYTIKLILDNFNGDGPPASIKKIGTFFTSPWKISFANVAGKVYSLDNIEHDIIRKQWNEPRIHFAVNCASRSCPPIISEPYLGSSLDNQLEASTRAFLSDTRMNYLQGETLYISSIFKWYGEDFKDNPVQFILDHSEGELHEGIAQLGKEVRIKYLDYDWSLNGKTK